MSTAKNETLKDGSLVDLTSLYQPLDQLRQEIRLIRILYDGTEANEHDVDIKCEMEVFPLISKDTRYIALSYCWTEAEPTETILINHTPFWIRPNLHAFISRMHKEWQQSWIFVDAVCVNQANVAERNQQVAAMGDVFSNAVKVIVWLGEPLFESAEIERNFLCDCEAIATSSGRWSYPTHVKFEKFAEVFLQEQYWSRVWIVQEVILASSLEIRAGRLFIDEKTFDRVWRLYEASLQRLKNEARLNRVRQLRISLRDRRRDASLSIVEALGFTIFRQCSERRDKVYGLLGLTRKLVKVDYGISAMELLIRTCVSALFEIQVRYRSYTIHPSYLSACETLTQLPKVLSLDHETCLAFVAVQLVFELCAADHGPITAHVAGISTGMMEDYIKRTHRSATAEDPQHSHLAKPLTYEEAKQRAYVEGPDSDFQKELNDLTMWVRDIFDETAQQFSNMGLALKWTN